MKKHSAPVVRMGSLEFHKVNAKFFDWRDIYQGLLTLSWPVFFILILALYLALNLVFSLFYHLEPGDIDGAKSLADDFFFSIETFSTVGYGHMFPSSFYGHLVASAEIITGLFSTAVITGLIFVRFSRPTARMLFSKCLVIAPFDGQPALMFRVANLRHYAMAEAKFRLMMMRYETTKEGDEVRRFYPLTLHFDHLISFPAAITIRHIISEESPLAGHGPEKWAVSRTTFLASIVCIDTVIQAPIQSQHHYTWQQVRLDHQFVEIYSEISENHMAVDYSLLHETEPVRHQPL